MDKYLGKVHLFILNLSIIGGYGKVQKCIHKITKEVRAVKIMNKAKMNSSELTRLKYEIDVLKNLDHPSILKLFEIFED
jgi:calcium-dependent protein kinase